MAMESMAVRGGATDVAKDRQLRALRVLDGASGAGGGSSSITAHSVPEACH